MPLDVSNLLLRSLLAENRSLVLSLSKRVSLPLKTVLYEPGQTPPYAYFLEAGLASIVTPMLNGATAEVDTVGNEGVVGGLHLLGSALPATRCFMQIEGSGLRIRFSDLKHIFRSCEEVRDRVHEYVQMESFGVGQMVGCNALHEAEPRLARWLLIAQDRTQTDTLKLTQEFLAQMVGTQRSTVSLVARALERRGLIEHRRSLVRIVDREKLEAAACECYPIMKRLYAGLYGGSTGKVAKLT